MNRLRDESDQMFNLSSRTRLRAPERILTQTRYEEEVEEADMSGFQFTRATTEQLQNALEAFSRQEMDLTDCVVEEVAWEEESRTASLCCRKITKTIINTNNHNNNNKNKINNKFYLRHWFLRHAQSKKDVIQAGNLESATQRTEKELQFRTRDVI